MWRLWKNKSGFTLIESLLSLLLIGIITQTLMLSIQSYRRVDTQIREDYSAQWHQFIALIERELALYSLVDLSDGGLVIEEKTTGKQYDIVLRNNKIYKRKGHQPLLYEVTKWELNYEAPFLNIVIEFENGQQFGGTILIRKAINK